MNQDIREQLSSLIDGELDRDRMRFLLRRSEHDEELAALWQRWHFVGEAMRGSALPLRKDFASSIIERLNAEEAGEMPAPLVSKTANVMRWGGGFAVAASVALVALLFAQPTVQVTPTSEPSVVASSPELVSPVETVASTVAPSPYREQDLRPPYRLDTQTVSANEPHRYGHSVRFDPGFEASWLRHQQAITTRAVEQPQWRAPMRPHVAEPVQAK